MQSPCDIDQNWVCGGARTGFQCMVAVGFAENHQWPFTARCPKNQARATKISPIILLFDFPTRTFYLCCCVATSSVWVTAYFCPRCLIAGTSPLWRSLPDAHHLLTFSRLSTSFHAPETISLYLVLLMPIEVNTHAPAGLNMVNQSRFCFMMSVIGAVEPVLQAISHGWGFAPYFQLLSPVGLHLWNRELIASNGVSLKYRLFYHAWWRWEIWFTDI